MTEYIGREAAMQHLLIHCVSRYPMSFYVGLSAAAKEISAIPAADVVEVDKVAEILRLSFGDDCACNYNGNDEWLWEKCKYADTDCPYPKDDNGCWKEFVKHFIAKMDGKGEGE